MFDCNIFYLNNANHKFMVTLFDCDFSKLQNYLNCLEKNGYKILNVVHV